VVPGYLAGMMVLIATPFVRGPADAPRAVPLGGAQNARVRVDPTDAFGSLPITVELWIKLERSDSYNILVARGPKAPGHWELYTLPGSGMISVYHPDLSPTDVQSQRSVTDGRWHFIGWRCDGKRSELFVDGEQVVSTPVSGNLRSATAPIEVGRLIEGTLQCRGEFRAMRISGIARDLAGMAEPFAVDPDTLCLWTTADLAEGVIEGQGSAPLRARVEPPLLSAPSAMLPDDRDATERDEQLALPLSGDPLLDYELALPVVGAGAEPVENAPPQPTPTVLSLNGRWFMQSADPGAGIDNGYWAAGVDRSRWIPADVPCTVQSALLDAGLMPHPFWADNWFREVGGPAPGWPMKRRGPEKLEWWLARGFDLPADWPQGPVRLAFDGVDYSARFFLNGQPLGAHEGMFGGPEFDVSALVRRGERNTLVVAIDPPPPGPPADPDWRGRPVPSVGYGWHYGHLISMGVWRGVGLESVPAAEVRNPYVITRSLDGDVEIDVTIVSGLAESVTRGVFLSIALEGSDRPAGTWRVPVDVRPGLNRVRTRVRVPDAQVWWPLGYGEQPLYRLRAWVEGGGAAETTFGVRTLEMRRAPNARPGDYAWQFVVNGREVFLKGANWCYPDPLLRQEPERYRHFIELARRAGVQLFRVWGGGPVEGDPFYDLCDRTGILVWQEFPYCFDAPDTPGTDPHVLDDQAARVVRRLRNHPSLVLWGGGNEIQQRGMGDALKLLGKRVRQLDSTRAYHITSPWGGDVHNWNVFHGGAPIENYRDTPGPFLSEFGLPSSPARDSLLLYVPENALGHWPPQADDWAVISHSQQFSLGDWGKMLTYAGDYGPVGSWDDFITNSQMAQADALRYGAELMRARAHRGGCGFTFYKLTDVFPGQSWSVVDYYGVPKLAYYAAARVCRPVHAFATFERFQWAPGEEFTAQVHVANDSPANVTGARLAATVYGADGKVLSSSEGGLTAAADGLAGLPEVALAAPEGPFLLCVTLTGADGSQLDESWYWFSFAEITDAVRAARALPHWGYPEDKMPEVFQAYAELPRSRLREALAPTTVEADSWREESPGRWTTTVRNTGPSPAFMVTVTGVPPEPGWYLSDNAFCLRPGAEAKLTLDGPQGEAVPELQVTWWNGG